MKKLNVKIRRGEEATLEKVISDEPDVVIVATGARSVLPMIPGIDKSIVEDSLEVLRGEIEVGDKVIVIGADMVGCEIAWLLAEKESVALVTRNKEQDRMLLVLPIR